MRPPIRFGIAGAGAIASTYVRAFEGLPARVVGVADPDPLACERLSAPIAARAFESPEELALRGGIEAAIVCTPPSTHAEVSAAFAALGIPVLCEKPLARDTGEAVQMLESSQSAGALLAISSKFRHCAGVARAKQLLEEGAVGRLLFVEVTFTSSIDMRNRWNSNPRVSGGGVLIDNGTHAVDLVLHLAGPVAEVAVIEGRRRQSPEVEDTASLFARSLSGVEARCDLSWSIPTANPAFLRLIGSSGSIDVAWREYDKVACFRSLLENFRGAIAGTEPLRMATADALASVQIIDAAYLALRHGGWHRVADRRSLRRAV